MNNFFLYIKKYIKLYISISRLKKIGFDIDNMKTKDLINKLIFIKYGFDHE